MTKREQCIVECYNETENRGLFDCYNQPSPYKISAYEDIKSEKISLCGYGLKVLSYNTFMFTCAYKYINEKGVEILVHHTPTKKEEIIIGRVD